MLAFETDNQEYPPEFPAFDPPANDNGYAYCLDRLKALTWFAATVTSASIMLFVVAPLVEKILFTLYDWIFK
jgi:hypothetical protein